jgi:exosome complex component CSL4
MKRGDTVIARVDEVREQLARVDIGVLKGYEDRQLPLPDAGTIHVSQVRDSYVKDLLNEFKAGDVVRAKVLNAQRSPIQLSTVGDDLGVIVAFCSKCKAPLDIDGSKLKCPECGNVEFRKIASNYRRGVL